MQETFCLEIALEIWSCRESSVVCGVEFYIGRLEVAEQ